MSVQERVSRSWDRRLALLVGLAALLALLLRLAWGLWADRTPVGLFDPVRYAGYGRAIADGQGMIEPFTGYPTAYYPPGYPWFVGIVTWLARPFTDSVVTAVVVVQAFLGACTVVAGSVVGRHVGGRRTAVAAAFGLAVYPNLVLHSGTVLGETLYDFLFLTFCALVVAVRWPEGLSTRRVAGAGLVLGLAVMVRPISLAILPVVALAWWVGTRDRRLVLRSTLLLVVAVGACIVPWTVRNAVRMDSIVPISTNTGDNLCIGHASGATGAFTLRGACDTEASLLDGPAGEVAADKEKQGTAVRGFLDEPGREPWLLWRRFWFTWVRDGDHDAVVAVQSYGQDPFLAPSTEQRLIRTADAAYWFTAAAGTVAMVALLRRRRGPDIFLVGSALATAAVPLLFFGDSRFKVPVMALLVIIAATLVDRPWRADTVERAKADRRSERGQEAQLASAREAP